MFITCAGPVFLNSLPLAIKTNMLCTFPAAGYTCLQTFCNLCTRSLGSYCTFAVSTYWNAWPPYVSPTFPYWTLLAKILPSHSIYLHPFAEFKYPDRNMPSHLYFYNLWICAFSPPIWIVNNWGPKLILGHYIVYIPTFWDGPIYFDSLLLNASPVIDDTKIDGLE